MLDQGQTITVDTVDHVYNLVVFDKYRTERVADLGSELSSQLNLDHTKLLDDQVFRHLHQCIVEVEDSVSGEKGEITINLTVTHPKWASKTTIGNWVTGFTAKVNSILSRTLVFES